MVYGATYLGDGDHRTRAARREVEEEEVTERTEAFLRASEETSDGGYVTPCEDWIRADEVRTHAERCARCREASDAAR